jgi:hypothetical protein
MDEIFNSINYLSNKSSVERVQNLPKEWHINGLLLQHKISDYFNIGYYQIADKHKKYLIQQKEGATVFLLIGKSEGKEYVLLNYRFEPGLIGSVNLTTTIQSTPNNFKREHGGKHTPFVEMVFNPENFGQVLYDSYQFDWGDFYLEKTKRFLLVELDYRPPIPEGYAWFPLENCYLLCQQNHLITNDLRVTISLLNSTLNIFKPKPEKKEIPFSKCNFQLITKDSDQVEIGLFKTTTKIREVSTWTQPLLIPSRAKKIVLYYFRSQSEILCGVELSSQIGLLGKKLFFPASLSGGTSIKVVNTSAEGGRFWKYPISIEIRKAENKDDCQWVEMDELAQRIALSECALELILAFSVLVSVRKDL